MEITSKKNGSILKIYINNKLHLVLNLVFIYHLRSHFIKGQNEYFIDIYYHTGNIFTLKYDKQEKFEDVLFLIDEAIK